MKYPYSPYYILQVAKFNCGTLGYFSLTLVKYSLGYLLAYFWLDGNKDLL